MRVVVFEAPGGGRDATVSLLAQALAVPQTSLGDFMRANISQGTDLGIRVSELTKSGNNLVDENLITEVVRDGLERLTHTGFLLLGHPGTLSRALALDDLLREFNAPLDGVVNLRLPDSGVERRIHRLAAWRRCRNDRAHRFIPDIHRLGVEGLCHCGGKLYQHEDETETRYRNMYLSYEAMLEPITQHYAEQGLLVTVDAAGTFDEISGRALAALQNRSR
ncbi:nucleoside monophosphate kinase [Streptomyces sp. NPDC050392]|uniref:nucleoside monophosphate kinase n=1 Tax=Streptomyces sp. NPDC050392 TaxID=3155782 RepID=UPI003414963A